MSFYATHTGQIELSVNKLKKAGIDTQEDIRKFIKDLGDRTDICIDICLDKSIVSLVFDDNEKYYEEEWSKLFNAVADYAVSGEIDFIGEDDSRWRYVFKNGTFVEENGRVVYNGVYAVYVIDYADDNPDKGIPKMVALYDDEDVAQIAFNRMSKYCGKKYLLLAFLQFDENIKGHQIIEEVNGWQ